jgi:hypothetical protein
MFTDLSYSALDTTRINDIPVCSCRVTTGVTLGHFVVILRTLFWKVCTLFVWVLAA